MGDKVIEFRPDGAPRSHKTTTVVMHLATPVGWTEKYLGESGRDKLKKSLEVLMNANAPVETGPGGAILMGMFFRTDAPGDAETIEMMRTEYPLESPKNYHESSEEPWGFTEHEDEELTLKSAVYQAVGGASACWENLRGAGVFREDMATEVAEALLAFIHNHFKTPQPEPLCGCAGGKCDLHPER